MTRKLFLTLIVLMMFLSSTDQTSYSEFEVGLEATETTPDNIHVQSESLGDFSWHHDCSNMTDFVEVVNNTWALTNDPNPQNVVNGTLESSGTYVHPTDFGTGTDYFGPLYYVELASPISIMNFVEIRATMEIDSTLASEGGMICVILNDQNNVPIIGMTITDGWSGSHAGLPDASWTYGNGSQINIDSGIWSPGQYSETMRVWLNTTGVYCEFPQIGEYKLVDLAMIDKSREIQYVSIHALQWESFTPCEALRVHDIQLTWNSDPTPIWLTWQDDCTGFTNFADTGDITWPRYTSTEVTGTLASAGGYIYATGYGTGSSWHGPLVYHELAQPFDVSQFISFTAELELDHIAADRMGEIAVSLHDEMNKTVATLVIHDRWVAQDVMVSSSAWRFSNCSILSTPNDRVTDNATVPYHETLEMFQNETGIFVNVPRIGNFKLVDQSSPRSERLIKYVSIQIMASSTYTPCDTMRVHDVTLTWQNTSTAVAPEAYILHDPCTGAGNWIYGVNYWNGWTPWSMATGTLESMDGYLHTLTNDGSWSGPLWYKPIDTAANVTDFHSLSVEAQVTSSDPNYEGAAAVVLYDQYRQPIIWYYYKEWTASEYDIDLYVYYRLSNGTSLSSSLENITNSDWTGVIRTFKNTEGGISVEITGGGTTELVPETEMVTEASRQIRYIGISWRLKTNPSWYLNTRLLDIVLTTANLTSPTVSVSNPSNNTVQESTTPVSIAVTDESGVDLVLASWDGNPNDTLVYPYQTSIPSGDGEHSLVVYAEDTLGAYSVESYTFTTDDSAPSIDTVSDIDYFEGDGGYSIDWGTPSDAHPSSYIILENETEYQSGFWNSTSESFLISVEGLPYGTHNYTLVLYDIVMNSAAEEVLVRVHDDTLPTIDSPSSYFYNEGDSGNEIEWDPQDINPYRYEIFRNTTTLVKSGLWNASIETISISADGLELGVYNYTIVVFDKDSNSASDDVYITVIDSTLPTIDHPLNFAYTEGELDKFITWSPYDLHPYSYEVYRNDTRVGFGPWDGLDLVIPVSGLALGVWNITLIVMDTSNNIITDTVMVTVFASGTSPTTTTTTDTTTDTPTTTTSSTSQEQGDPMVLIAGVSGILGLIAIAVIFLFKKRGTGVPSVLSSGPSDVKALRGGEFVGNRFRFKVKVNNSSKRVITDVCVTLTSYPKDSLKLEDEASRTISKLEPKGFRSPTFEFLPTKDCVKGDLIATVSWVDANGQPHSTSTRPYTIRAVCDLLKPESITPDDFVLKLATLGHGETITKVDDWTPEEMHEKTVQILKDSNFFEVTSEVKPVGDYVEVGIQGWAKGMYTGKNLGIQITISGKPHSRGATCKVRVSGEDEAMILPAIDEVSQKLGAWLCPRCGGILPIESVKKLKGGKSVACPFCNVTVDR